MVVRDAGDETQVKAHKKQHELNREREVEEFRAILGTYGGRAFIWRMLEQAKVFQVSFVVDEPHTTSFNEGQRQVGIWLLNEVMEVDNLDDVFSEMRAEAVSRDTKNSKKEV